MHSNPKVVDAVVDLGAMALMLGRINRATFHPDGVTPESDADHTVMLGLVAPALAGLWPQYGLDQGRVAELAAIHDLVEVYAGDTSTLLELSQEAKLDKAIRESKALDRIVIRFGPVLPWISLRLFEYEHRRTPEARFVKAVDKFLPKICGVLGSKQALTSGITAEEMKERYHRQIKEIAVYAGNFPELLKLGETLMSMDVEETWGSMPTEQEMDA